MNRLNVKVQSMDACDGLTFFSFSKGTDFLHSIVIDGKEKNMGLKHGDSVILCFKESEVFLAKDFMGNISVCNQLKATVKNIEQGHLFSKIRLDYQGEEIIALIISAALKPMNLKINDSVYCMVKANEIAIIREQGKDD
ncbi:MAG: TOBE domain-containing protein [Candidatus Omnitrophica bacterium]|nr:TOBE domain-containing protein [Candidatus Omnitrophota bacterium]